MKRIMLAGLAAFLLGTAVLASPAEARCWWNGFACECWRPPPWAWRHHHPYWRHYGWGYGPYWHHRYWYP